MARHAIVTGASRGIGRAIAIGLARRGYDLALTDIAAQEKVLLETVAEVRKLGGRCIPVLGDVSDIGDCRRAVAEAIQGLGHIDVLVNNAGILRLATIDELTTDTWDQTFAVNTRGVFQMTQAVVAHMKERKYGRIVNIACSPPERAVRDSPTTLHRSRPWSASRASRPWSSEATASP